MSLKSSCIEGLASADGTVRRRWAYLEEAGHGAGGVGVRALEGYMGTLTHSSLSLFPDHHEVSYFFLHELLSLWSASPQT
jgi:hypothetical protein